MNTARPVSRAMRSGAVSDTMSDAADKAVAQSLVVAVPVIGVIYNAILAFMAHTACR